MSSFRIVDTSFRILKGGKIGLAASIALIGGTLTLGSTSANAESFFGSNVTLNHNYYHAAGGGGNEHLYADYAYNSGSTSGTRYSTSTVDDVIFSPSFVSRTFTGVSWNEVNDDPSIFNVSYQTNTTPTYSIYFNAGANANDIYKDYALGYTTETTSSTWGVSQDGTDYADIYTYNAGEDYTANLIFQGTNVVSGYTDIDAGNIRLNGGVTFAGTVQAGSADVYTSSQITFNDHVDLTPGTTDTLKFYNGGNVVLNNGLAGNVDFNGQNATVTLSNGNINGDIDTSTNGSGTLKFTTSTTSSVTGNIGTTANLKEIIMDGTGSVDVNGSVDTNLVTFNSAGTLQVNSLDTTRGDSTLGTVNFKEFNGTLKVDGGDLTGNIVTDLGNNGIVTMMNGSQSITGQIGTITNKIQTLNIGDNGEDSYSVTTMNGDIYAQNIVFNNLSTTNGSELRIADDYDVTAAITTADDGMGTLKLLGGTQTVTGQVGTNGMRLAEIRSGEADATSTFKNSVYSDNVYVAAGSTTFDSTLTVTDLLSSSGTLLAKGATVVDGAAGKINITDGIATFKNTVNVSGTGGDIFVDSATANFEDDVTVNDLISADNTATINMGSEDSSITVSAGNIIIDTNSSLNAFADITVANNMTVSDGSEASITGDLTLSGEDSILTIANSDFTITGATLLSSNDVGYSDTSIVINNSMATFDGTVTVSSEDGDLNIADTTVASLVKFNDTVNIGNDITITNNIAGEDAYSLVSEDVNYVSDEDAFKWNYVQNPLATKVEFNANVTTGNNLSIDNAVVNFGNLASGEGEEAISENIVVANIGNNLNLTNSYVTLNGDLNVTEDMTVKNSYGHFTASGADALVTVGNNLTINDQSNTAEEVSFITFDSEVNVGNSFIIAGNDNDIADDNVLPQGEITTVILNDTVTVGNNLTIDEAFVSIKGDGEDSLSVGNDATIGEDSFVQISGGDITIDRDMTLEENSDLYVGIKYYDLMTDMYSDGILDGDYSASTITEMTIGRNLVINNSMAWLGNEAMNGEDVSIAENIVNVTVAGNATIESNSNVGMVGDLTLTGATSTLTISESDFDIVGNTLLSGEDATSIVINNSNVTFDGTVTVSSTTGDLNVTDTTGASNVTFEDTVTVGDAIAITGFGVNKATILTFNGNVTATDITIEDATINMGGENAPITVLAGDELNIFDSTLTAYADITVEDDMDISGSVVTITGDTDVTNALTISDSTVASDVEFNGEVVAGSILVDGVNGNKDTNVAFNDIVSTTANVSIVDATVTFNDTLDVGSSLYITDSDVTFEKAVTIEDESYIYSYDRDTTVHFKDTVIVNADIFVGNGNYSYGDTIVTFDKNLTINSGEDNINGTLHINDDNVVVTAKGNVFADVSFSDDYSFSNGLLKVANEKNIYGTVTTGEDGYGTLKFLGSTTLQDDIGEVGMNLDTVVFGAGDIAKVTQEIGYDVYAQKTVIGNSLGEDSIATNSVVANITDNVTFGGDLVVKNGSTLNVSDNDIHIGNNLVLKSDSTTNFKVYTTDISAGEAVENQDSGSITTNYLSLADDAKFNITYDGSWYGAGKYNLIDAGEDGFVSGEDYVGTESNGLVSDNSIIDSVIKRYVDNNGNEYLTLYADRTGDGSYEAEDLYIEKSDIGDDYSNGASQSLAGYADGTARAGALADIINDMEDLEDGITISDKKKQQMQEIQRLLAPTANNSAIQSSLTATNLGLSTIAGRIADVRGAGVGGNILAFNDSAKTGLSAGESTLDSSLWVKAIGSTASQDKVEQYDGYKSNTYGIVAGADKTLKNGLTVGVALTYADTSTKQKDLRSGDNSDTNTIQATAYASQEFGNLYVDGMLSYANHSTDAIRTANSGKLSSDVKADQIAAKVETGYRFAVGETTTLTPFASLEYSMLDQKGYTEKGTAYQNDALKVDGVKVNKGTVGLGTKLATNVKAGNTTLIPELTVGVYNSFGDDSTDIKAQFVGGGDKFVTPTQELNETMINVGAGVKMQLSDTSSLILDADHDRSSNGDFTGYSGSLSYRLNF